MSAIRDQGVGEAFFDHECHLKEILADLHEKLSQAEMKLEAQKRRAEEGEERLRRQKEEKVRRTNTAKGWTTTQQLAKMLWKAY